MPRILARSVEKARQWPADVANELVDPLLLANSGAAGAVARACREETDRCVADIRSGGALGVYGEAVMVRARTIEGP
jgi:hypothetical protein